MNEAFVQQYKLIGSIQSHIASSTTLEGAIQGALRLISSDCDVELAIVWYADGDDETVLRPYFWVGDRDLSAITCPIGHGPVGRVYETQEAERILDCRASEELVGDGSLPGLAIESMVCVPFVTMVGNLGCIQFVNHRNGQLFSEEEADTFDIAVMLTGVAIDGNESLQTPWEPGNTIMELRGVTREFQNGDEVTQVLKGINLDIYEGEFLVLLGESGCGKTTLLNIIGGLDHVTDGSVVYAGQDLTDADQSQLTEYRRANVGFIFQSYNLMPNLNALQNVKLIAELVDEPMDSQEALELVGLGDRMRNYPSQLSGGQQQRVSIARALSKRPRLILADEPTAALDYATSVEVLQVMEEVIGNGTTLVMVTHNEEIARMADRIVRLRGGRTYETTINRHRAHAEDLVW